MMSLLSNNKNFYSTPKNLIRKMTNKLDDKWNDINFVLEPSAGKGDIISYLEDITRRQVNIHAIEKDQDLASILLGKRINVIDYDFLEFCGQDKYDLIIGNPPFDEGDKHLLKAIEILYSGHIVFLLNAETLKNPYTNTRKVLVDKLKELNADIEYIDNAFIDAERKTKVEIALVHIEVKRDVEEDLFEGMDKSDTETEEKAHEQTEIASKESLRELVADYNRTIEIGTQTIINFYKNYHHISSYLSIESAGDRENNSYYSDNEKLTKKMKISLNKMIVLIRKDYWSRALKLDCVSSRLTKKKQEEFYKQLQDNSNVDFTEKNVLIFITRLIGSYEQTLNEAVDHIFERMTRDFAWDKDIHNKNVHYFNGWCTNKAFFVNKKVIMPFYNHVIDPWHSKVKYDVRPELDDIDKVMNYFDGRSQYTSIADAIDNSSESSKIESTYFIITHYKKGTVHLTFKDENIRRRFNVTACKGRKWLPQDYGQNKYNDLDDKTQKLIDEFEGKQSYDQNLNLAKNLYSNKNLAQLPFIEK
jgi:methylase of polypeptide subunit release factors